MLTSEWVMVKMNDQFRFFLNHLVWKFWYVVILTENIQIKLKRTMFIQFCFNFWRQASQTSKLDVKKKFVHIAHFLEASRLTWSSWVRSADLVSRRAVILPGTADAIEVDCKLFAAAVACTSGACTTNLLFRGFLFPWEIAREEDRNCLSDVLAVAFCVADAADGTWAWTVALETFVKPSWCWCWCGWFWLLSLTLVLDTATRRELILGAPISWLKMSFINSRRVASFRQFGQFGLLQEKKCSNVHFKFRFYKIHY